MGEFPSNVEPHDSQRIVRAMCVGVVPLMWASWRVIEFVGSMVVAIWVLAAAIAAMVFVMEVVPGAGFLIGSTIFGYFVAFIYVALGVLAILDHTHRLPRWA